MLKSVFRLEESDTFHFSGVSSSETGSSHSSRRNIYSLLTRGRVTASSRCRGLGWGNWSLVLSIYYLLFQSWLIIYTLSFTFFWLYTLFPTVIEYLQHPYDLSHLRMNYPSVFSPSLSSVFLSSPLSNLQQGQSAQPYYLRTLLRLWIIVSIQNLEVLALSTKTSTHNRCRFALKIFVPSP